MSKKDARSESGTAGRRSTRVKTGMALAGSLFVLGTVALGAVPANAAAPAHCAAHDVCVWKDAGYTTNNNSAANIVYGGYIPNYGTWNYLGTTDSGANSISSTYNNGATHSAYYFKGNNGSGSAVFTKAAGTGDSDFNNGTPTGDFNDHVNSSYFSDYLPS